MDEPSATQNGSAPRQSAIRSPDQVINIIFESAIEAFVKAMLVMALGGIAVGVLSQMWNRYAPSPPPFHAMKAEAEAPESSSSVHWNLPVRHKFLIAFGVIFVPTVWMRVVKGSKAGESGFQTRTAKIMKRLSDDWFSLIVFNAFGAAISAALVVAVQQWSPSRIVLGHIFSELKQLAGLLLGENRSQGLQAWFAWYDENKYRLTFWLLYLAAIADDLGIPNFKTVGRWLIKKTRQRAS